MPLNELLAIFLATTNEVLSAAIVIIAVSLLLYNLTRNRNNRVARASAAVLASVTVAYICDVYLSLGPDERTASIALRLQWIGIAFIPSALFHLSDALLATTGLPSRGRRRRVVRILYGLSVVFLLAALFSNIVIDTLLINDGLILMRAGNLFIVYTAFFITACIATFINVQRARKRGLTPGSRRRLAYLQVTILMPALGIFPYSTLVPAFDEVTVVFQLMVNIANIIVILMLLFLSYPLSFFGSDVPDRVVKVELMRFLLRGPATGLLALAVIIFTSRSIDILGIAGQDFMPFAVVSAVLLWQWLLDPALPWLEKQLVYNDDDDEQLTRLRELSERALTREDLLQLTGATLEAFCDYLRSKVAFVAMRAEPDGLEIVKALGEEHIDLNSLGEQATELFTLAQSADRVTQRSAFQPWQSYQVVPLYSKRVPNGTSPLVLIGVLAVIVPDNPVNLVDDEDVDLIYTYVQRTEQTLDDLILQSEIFAALEGLLPQLTMTRKRAAEVEYRPGYAPIKPSQLPDREEAYEQVRAALRHYWGGPGMTRSRLLELDIVQHELQEAETPIQALRTVLKDAIEKQRPTSERTMTAPEWTVYNILDLRFIERKKVRDVARRLSISEPDLYRKQRAAIQAVADSILQMEQDSIIS